MNSSLRVTRALKDLGWRVTVGNSSKSMIEINGLMGYEAEERVGRR